MLTNELQEFAMAVRHASSTFNDPKQKKHLRDLSPRFWVALLDLVLDCENEDWSQLRATFNQAYRQLGAPGDFGYGTPCGDALKDLYYRWNELCQCQRFAVALQPAGSVA